MNMWDERYSTPGYAFGTEPNEFLAQTCQHIPRGRVLSLGEGEGRNAVHLAKQGHAVTAVDQSAIGLEKVRRLAAENGVTIDTIPTDLADFQIEPNSWDGIVSIFCHLPLALRARIHGQIVAGLRPGGAYLLEAYTPRQLEFGTGGPRDLELLVTLEDLRAELDGLHLEYAVEIERDVTEGRYHTGRAAVAQVVAVKPQI